MNIGKKKQSTNKQRTTEKKVKGASIEDEE